MKLAVSNIAWTKEEEPAIAELLQSLGVKYIEVAPTKQWDEPINATREEAEAYRDWWAGYGITVVAFQSMLFTHPELKLFESPENRAETKKYLAKFIELAGYMGAQRMVFGSPKNRQKGELAIEDANNIAKEFFNELGDVAQANEVVFCIEPNAPQYNCDFVTTAHEGLELVEDVYNPGFGLHLDIACMTLAGDDIAASINEASSEIKHFHISSPMLDAVHEDTDVRHDIAADALKEIGYDGYVSIEMRPGGEGENLDRVKRAVSFAQKAYGSL